MQKMGPSGHGSADNAGGTRDGFVDGLRGLALVLLTLDHIRSPITQYTFESLGFFSAAEIFVFISGFVSGFVYSPRHQGVEPGVTRAKAWHRAGVLWCTYILAFVAGYIIRKWYPSEHGTWNEILDQSLLHAVALGGTLLARPNYIGILPVYIVALALTPYLMSLLERKRSEIVYILCASGWLTAQLGGTEAISRAAGSIPGAHMGYFDIMGWQALFFLGLYFGHRRGPLTGILSKGDVGVTIGLVLVSVLLLVAKHGWLQMDANPMINIPNWLTARQTLGPLRFLNFLVVAALIARVRHLPTVSGAVRPFAYLGRASLAVFIAHDILAALLPLEPGEGTGGIRRILVVGAAVGCLYAVAWATFRFSEWRKCI